MANFENHPDYEKNVKALEAQGYHAPTAEEMAGKTPSPRDMNLWMEGSILTNAKGQRKHVSCESGEITDIEPLLPQAKIKFRPGM